jgi:hypothetical protein
VAKPNRTTVPINVQVSPEVAEAFRRFADQREESLRYVLESAIRRHIANPPPRVVIPPLPPAPVVPGTVNRKPGRPRKS